MINFYEMLEKQKVLDKAINQAINPIADRDEIKIRLSMIAKIIEFQETLEKSEFTREDRLEKFVDIFFFWCQLLLASDIVVEKSENEDLNKFFNDGSHHGYKVNDVSYHEYKVNELTIRLIVESSYKKYGQLEFLGAIARNQGFTDDEINEMHDKKFKKNLERIGVEWQKIKCGHDDDIIQENLKEFFVSFAHTEGFGNSIITARKGVKSTKDFNFEDIEDIQNQLRETHGLSEDVIILNIIEISKVQED